LTKEEVEYRRFDGPKLRHCRPEGKPTAVTMLVDSMTAASRPASGAGIKVDVLGRQESPPVGLLGYEFILKNCLRRWVPVRFDPDDLAFGDHAAWLVKAWSGCLLELYALADIEQAFAVGFVFSEDTVAEHETGDYGRVYYLNPCQVTRRGVKNRYRKADGGMLAAVAAHEFVHGAYDLSYHGEDYASKLTDTMGLVVNHWRRFARHFT
jgi:hypothetical protein